MTSDFQFYDEEVEVGDDTLYLDGFGTVMHSKDRLDPGSLEPSDEDVYDFVELRLVDEAGKVVFEKNEILAGNGISTERLEEIARKNII